MAVTLTGNINLTASIQDARTAVSGAASESGTRTTAFQIAWQIASGTGASQADVVWSDTRTVTTGATDILDLSGVLTNAFGATVSFVKLRAILLSASTANTTTLQLARPAAATGVTLFAAVSDALAPLSPGGFTCWVDPAAGVPVTNSTADLIHVINSAGSPSAIYTVVLVGTSA